MFIKSNPVQPRFSGYFAFNPPADFANAQRFERAYLSKTSSVGNVGTYNRNLAEYTPPDHLDSAFFELGKMPGVKMYYQPELPDNEQKAKIRQFIRTLF